MPDNLTVSDFLAEYRQAETAWQNFRRNRLTMDALLWRTIETKIQSEHSGLQHGIDYRTPDIEADVQAWVDALANPTRFLGVPLISKPGPQAKEEAHDFGLFMARAFTIMDGFGSPAGGRDWHDSTSEGQVRHGVRFWRLNWEPIVKTEVTEWPFFWEHVDPYGFAGIERNGQWDAVYYHGDIPLLEAQEAFAKGGQKPTLVAGPGSNQFAAKYKLGWIGTTQAIDKSLWQSRLKFLVRDARALDGRMWPLEGCNHPQRMISTSLYCNEAADGEVVEEIDSPFRYSSFYVVPGRVSMDPDYDLKFRPQEHRLYVEGQWINYLSTLIAVLAREDYADAYFYVSMANLPPGVVMPEGGVNVQFNKPDTVTGKIPGYWGDVKRFPTSISPHLTTLLEQAWTRFAEAKASRYLTATAYDEAQEGTADAYRTATRQAHVPLDRMLSQQDKAVLTALEEMRHAIRWFDYAESKKTTYKLVSTGQEPMLAGQAKVAALTMDADAAAKPIALTIKTSSDTLEEQALRTRQALDLEARGFGTDEDIYIAKGTYDVEGERQKVRRYKIQKRYDDTMRVPDMLNILRHIIAAKLHIPYEVFQPQPPGPDGGNANQPDTQFNPTDMALQRTQQTDIRQYLGNGNVRRNGVAPTPVGQSGGAGLPG